MAIDVKVQMQPILSYYGGKQKLSKDICRALYMSPNWSERGHYIEPYFGGGAVFFAKQPQKMETINDLNDILIAFYRTVRDPQGFAKVKALLEGTLYSRSEFVRAIRILKGEEDASPEEKAWSVFVATQQGFAKQWAGSWGYSVAVPYRQWAPQTFRWKKGLFIEDICKRLDLVCIECSDALCVIKSRDSRGALFYLDPPYPNTHQCYGKFAFRDEDLAALLETLKSLKGFFMLSCFPHPLIDEAVHEQGWQIAKKRMNYCMNTTDPAKKAGKVECLISNYPFELEGWEIN